MPKGTLVSLLSGSRVHTRRDDRFPELTRQLPQNVLPQFLCLAEEFLVFDEEPVQFQRSVSIEPLPQDHVADVDRVGQSGVLSEFFQRRVWIIVIHDFYCSAGVPPNVWRASPSLITPTSFLPSTTVVTPSFLRDIS